MSSPEELAREKIDALLMQCGWILQNRSTINLSASRGVAIREALLKDRDEVDYLLFVDGKGIGTTKRRRQRQPPATQRDCAGNRNYLHGPGTGITNLPSFSAMKFPIVVDVPLASFLSMVIISLLLGWSGKHTLPPVGESFGSATFCISSAVKSTSSILEIFSPASDDCILL